MAEEAYVEVSDRWLLTADGGKAVKAGDPTGVRLYATPGTRVPASEAKRLGITKAKAKQQAAAPPEDKAKSVLTTKGSKPKGGTGLITNLLNRGG